jgi:methylenetetrahydrofolate dehydrogenase (NADP+)/methenyltetrahydrofolate cyclohydrolase
MARIIDGQARSLEIRKDLEAKIAQQRTSGARPPGLATILVGDDPASRVYVGRKRREAREAGMLEETVELTKNVNEREVLERLATLNARADVDGILVQLPLPKHLSAETIIGAIDPGKDVDGLHPLNQGALFGGRQGLRPCTPLACMDLLSTTGVAPRGKRAVVVGRSVLVGRPVAMLLLESDATVVMCHSRTPDLPQHVASAEVLVVAVGVPGLVRGDWIKPGAVVIDVGINRVDGRLVGDVEFAAAAERAGYITPVPGGVGPMTVAMLLRNTYAAYCAHCRGSQA